MKNLNENKETRHPNSAYAAFLSHKISKKEKYSWIAAGAAIVVLLLCWWARSSQ
jgi:hypothetical protein